MVRITEADFDKEYERIKQDSVEGNCIIFVASDVDAICACKIFQVHTSMHLVPPRDPSLIAYNIVCVEERPYPA